MSLRKENFDTRLSERIGLTRELETGIPEFDAAYFIRTSDQSDCRIFLSNATHRAAITKISDKGFGLIFTRNHMELGKYGSSTILSADVDIIAASEVNEIMDAVVLLVKGLQSSSPSNVENQTLAS